MFTNAMFYLYRHSITGLTQVTMGCPSDMWQCIAQGSFEDMRNAKRDWDERIEGNDHARESILAFGSVSGVWHYSS